MCARDAQVLHCNNRVTILVSAVSAETAFSGVSVSDPRLALLLQGFALLFLVQEVLTDTALVGGSSSASLALDSNSPWSYSISDFACVCLSFLSRAFLFFYFTPWRFLFYGQAWQDGARVLAPCVSEGCSECAPEEFGFSCWSDAWRYSPVIGFSWPHFDIGSIVSAVVGAVVGFVGALFRQNKAK